MTALENLRIATKIGLIAGVSILGLAVVAAIYGISDHRLGEAHAALDAAMTHEQAVSGAEARFLEARVAARIFSDTPSAAWMELVRIGVERAQRSLDDVGLTGDGTATSGQSVTADLTAYRAVFGWFAELKQRVGWIEDQGLRAATRDSAHALESVIEETREPQLMIQVLQMRRHEKDFIERRDGRYIEQMAARHREFAARLQESAIPAERRPIIAELAADYQRRFRSLAAAQLDEEARLDQLSQLAFRIQARLHELSIAARFNEQASKEQIAGDRRSAFWLMVGTLLVMATATLGLAAGVGLGIVRPILRLTDTMGQLASGQWHTTVGDTLRRDEVGIMARAVQVFRDAGVSNVRNQELREKAEADNERQRLWLKELIENLPVGVTVFDEAERVLYRNAAMNRLHPHPEPDRLIGLSMPEIMTEIATKAARRHSTASGRDPMEFAIDMERRYRAGPEGRFEISFPDGTAVDTHFRWLAGHHLIITQIDVSERHAAEARAVAAEKFLQEIFDNVPIGIEAYDEDRRLRLRNQFLQKITPVTNPDKLIGRSLTEVLDQVAGRHFDETEAGQRQKATYVSDILERYRDDAPERFTIPTPNGRIYAVRKLRNERNWLILVIADVTDLRLTEQRADAAERYLHNIVENLPVGVLLADKNNRILLRNEQQNRIFPVAEGFSPIGRSIEEIVSKNPPKHVSSPDGRVVTGADAFGTMSEAYRTDSDGLFQMTTELGRQCTLRYKRLPGGELVIITTDVTDLTAARREAERHDRLLKEAIETLSVGFSLYSSDGTLLLFNQQYLRELGGIAGKLRPGMTISDIASTYWDSCTDVPPLGVDPRSWPSQKHDARAKAAYLGASRRRLVEGQELSIDIQRETGTFRTRQLSLPSREIVRISTDITDLVAAQRAVERQERLLKNAIEALPVSFGLFSADGVLKLFNRHFQGEFRAFADQVRPGISITQFLSDYWDSCTDWAPHRIDPASWPTVKGDAHAKAAYIAESSDRFLKHKLADVDIEREYGIYRVRTVTLDDGDIVRIGAEITDLVTARQAVERQQRLLKDAIEVLPAAFSLYSRDGTLLLYNERYVREFYRIADRIKPGVPLTEIAGAYWDACTDFPPYSVDTESWQAQKHDPHAKEAYLKLVLDRLLSGKPFATDVERDNGTYRIHQSYLADGDVVRIGTDITDLRKKEAEIRRLSETALAQRTAILQEVLDSIPQAIAVLDQNHLLKFANRSLADMLVEPSDRRRALHGRSLDFLLHAAHIDLAPVRRMLEAGDARRDLEITSGDQRPLRIRAMPVTTGDIIVSISDLSRQRQEESDRLGHQQTLLRAEKSQALVALAGSIAHDFNNLLAVILGFASLANGRIKALGASTSAAAEIQPIVSAMDNVVTSAERGRNIVASLNALSKGREVETSAVDLRDIVRDSERLLRVIFPASVRLELHMPESPCRAVVNSTQIEQIITNLVINSVHALEGRAGQVVVALDTIEVDGGRAEGLRITDAAARRCGWHLEALEDGTVSLFVGVLSRMRYVRLRVVDDGTGFGEDVARKIFTPFFTTKSADKGTGLGLISVLEIVDSHRGGVHIRSRAGVGTNFMVLLPEIDAASNAPLLSSPTTAEPEAVPEPSGDIRTESRILVVDDEDRLVELATAVLESTGYEIEGFTDPIAALRRIESDPHAFDLVVTDQTMPGMTGRDLARRLQVIRPDLPIIVCTGYAGDIERAGDLPASIRTVLHKPYAPEDLARAVQTALAADPAR